MKKKLLILFSIVVVIFICLGLLLGKNSDECFKRKVIKNFTENRSRFENIQIYAMQLDYNLYINSMNGSVKYADNQKDDIQKSDVEDDIEYIIKDLGFYGIYGYDGNIKFSKAGSGNEIGICFIKSGITPESGSLGGYEKIIDNWFFYYFNGV